MANSKSQPAGVAQPGAAPGADGIEHPDDCAGGGHAPSTGRQSVLRVPPDMETCQQAAAWVAGFDDPKNYRPQVET